MEDNELIRLLELPKEFNLMKNEIDRGTLKIEWETEYSNMEFERLASFDNSKDFKGDYYIQWFETINMHSSLDCYGDYAIEHDIERFVSLYKLIIGGKKIIPPVIFMDSNFIDGKIDSNRNITNPVSVNDGNHRIALAKILKNKVIPVLIITNISSYIFSVSKWDISFDTNNILFEEKESKKKYFLKRKDFVGSMYNPGQFIFYYCPNWQNQS